MPRNLHTGIVITWKDKGMDAWTDMINNWINGLIHSYQRNIVQVLSIHIVVIYPAIYSPYEDRTKQIFIVFTAELYCKETKGIEKALGYKLKCIVDAVLINLKCLILGM